MRKGDKSPERSGDKEKNRIQSRKNEHSSPIFRKKRAEEGNEIYEYSRRQTGERMEKNTNGEYEDLRW